MKISRDFLFIFKFNYYICVMDNFEPISVSRSHLEDFIWMSYRYAIGRHTIAAYHHADTVYMYLKQFSEAGIQHAIVDIRREIQSAAQNACVFKHLALGPEDYCDPVTALLKHMYENNIAYTPEFWKTNICSIDRDGVEIIPRTGAYAKITEHEERYSYLNDIKDLFIWCKLVSALDKENYVNATYYADESKDPNKTVTKKCYAWYDVDRDGKVVRYLQAVNDLNNLTTGWHLNPEYLISVE